VKPSSSLSLELDPSLPLVAAIAQLTKEFYEETLEPKHVHRLRLITHELLENAFAHGVGGSIRLSIEIGPEADGSIARVATWNRVDSRRAQLLRETLAKLQAASDLLMHYQGALRTAAEHPHGPGAGLARLRAECDATISSHFDEEAAIVTIVAETRVLP